MTYSLAADQTILTKSSSLIDVYKYLQKQLIGEGKILEVGVYNYSQLPDDVQSSYLESKQLDSSHFTDF